MPHPKRLRHPVRLRRPLGSRLHHLHEAAAAFFQPCQQHAADVSGIDAVRRPLGEPVLREVPDASRPCRPMAFQQQAADVSGDESGIGAVRRSSCEHVLRVAPDGRRLVEGDSRTRRQPRASERIMKRSHLKCSRFRCRWCVVPHAKMRLVNTPAPGFAAGRREAKSPLEPQSIAKGLGAAVLCGVCLGAALTPPPEPPVWGVWAGGPARPKIGPPVGAAGRAQGLGWAWTENTAAGSGGVAQGSGSRGVAPRWSRPRAVRASR